ncbi:MAG TPA: hypothetical protein VNC11_10745 [Gemmatimonadaceae bacterium]|jgi:hypothetical protein|nr:hypothetical protein [Gemmatimonadaceae bacterium]
MSGNSQSAGEDLYIDFDGQQLVISSDEPRALEYFRRKYAHMLVSGNTQPIGKLSVLRSNGGYVVNGTVELVHDSTIDTLYDYLCHDVFQWFVSTRFDLIWLHAGAVEKNGAGTVIAGHSGHGKSTLVTQLCERGWHLLSDEYAPIMPETNEIFPYPRTPRRRIFPGRELRQMEFGDFKMEDIEIPAEAVRRTPVPLTTMVFPYFKIGEPSQIERLSSGDASMEIVRNTTNFKHHRRLGIEWIVSLVKQIPCYRLTYSAGADAADVLAATLDGK